MTTTAKPGVTETGEDVREVVRLKYGEAAKRAASGGSEKASCGCGCGCGEGGGDAITRDLYDAVTASSLPEKAVLASLGCGNPTALAELSAGEVVLDLGSGGGIDVLLSARRVGPTGKAYGVDMTDEMLSLARRNAAEAGATNVEFLRGEIESIPLPDDSVDVVIAAQAFHWFEPEPTGREFKRILRPGGYAALIWNERQLDTTAFLRDYEQLLLKYGRDYAKVRHENVSEEMLAGFFNAGFERISFPNEQVFDLAGIRGRLLSSSYMPDENDPSYEAMINELALLFAKHAENDRIKVFYDTNIFYSRL